MIEGSKFTYSGISPFEIEIKHIDIFPDDPSNVNDDHIHEMCEIYVNLTGNVSFMVENKIYPVSSGSVIITRPCEYHHCIYHSNDRHDHLWILFNGDSNKSLLDIFYNRKKGEGNLICLSEKQKKRVLELSLDIIRDGTDSIKGLSSFLQLLSILETADGKSEAVSETVPEDISRAVAFIGENLGNSFTVSDVAAYAHVSINTLERRFVDVLGTTPSAYIKKRRLARAAELLPTASSVGDVSEKCGFSDYSNFICLFRKQFGITPLKYKKLHATKTTSAEENA